MSTTSRTRAVLATLLGLAAGAGCSEPPPASCTPATELCDGKDNDCDGATDEGFDLGAACSVGLGECLATGKKVCGSSSATVCDAVAGTPAVTETCNGKDDDCDGATDDGAADCCRSGDTHACGVEVGVCHTGTATCGSDRSWGACLDAQGAHVVLAHERTESCNGRDDDCDGETDEGFDLGSPCTRGVGECLATGKKVCAADGTAACDAVPGLGTAEVCNAKDDDCDGDTDEGVAGCCKSGERRGCGVEAGVCHAGHETCASDGSWGTCLDALGNRAVLAGERAESCNGQDDDCDGETDEGLDLGAACTLGAGECLATGKKVCSSDGSGTRCDAVPNPESAERCNGKDDDCNGVTDDGFDLGAACSSGVGECAVGGWTRCASSGLATECDAVPGPEASESCDGKDNDCDGVTDDGYDVGSACSVGLGECAASGSMRCASSGLATECGVVPGPQATETCDGKDNDCDGVTDNGYDVGLACSEGVGACRASGTIACVASGDSACDAVAHPPGAETCDGTDDDCDGSTDEEGADGCAGYYVDADGDTYGVGAPRCLCAADATHAATRAGDCDDTSSTTYPGALEICSNLKDDDCNGQTDDVADADGDGWTRCEGDCCDTSSDCRYPVIVNPGALEVSNNGVDDDCDPSTPDTSSGPSTCSTGSAFTSVSPASLAAAMDLCATTTANPPKPLKKWGLISATFINLDGTPATGQALTDAANTQSAVLTDYGPLNLPRLGSTMAALSTGKMRDATDPGYVAPSLGTNLNRATAGPSSFLAAHANAMPTRSGCPAGTSFQDPVGVRLAIRVPTNVSRLEYRFAFFASSYSRWTCSTYDDFHLALLRTGATIPADRNIAFDSANPFVSLNHAYFTHCTPKPGYSCLYGTSELQGTGMENVGAGTGWRTATAPVIPGETITLDFMLFDMGDGVDDSVILLDYLHWY
ncbi:MAG: putative metal-binding motif-containing protein [Myxococcales bacterium]